MRTRALSLLVVGLVSGGVAAQCDPAGPGLSETDTPNKCIAVAAFDTYTSPPIYLQTNPPPSRKWVVQIKTVQPRGAIRDVNGQRQPLTGSLYSTALTVYGADTIYGNTSQLGTQDFFIGGAHDRERDDQVKCFTPAFLSDPCAPANQIAECFRANSTSGGNFGMMIEGSRGLQAVYDWNAGPQYSNRPSANFALGNPAQISTIPQTFVDPEIEENADGTFLYWVAPDPNNSSLNRIVRAVLNTTGYNRCGTSTVATLGNARIVAVPCQSSATLAVNVHSPTVVVNQATGEALGMLLSERVGNDSDEFWLPSLSQNAAGTGPQHKHTGPFANNTQWTNNGGVAGGTVYYANSGAANGFYAEAHYVRGCFLVGGTDPKGSGNAIFQVHLDDRNAGTANVAILLAGLAGRLAAPVPIPGIDGNLAINPAGAIPLGVIPIPGTDEVGQLPLPDLSAIGSDIHVPVQAVGFDAGNATNPARLIFSNIGSLDIQ